jgi:hypothetical protein
VTADEAERELMEWKKLKFMQDRLGEDFEGLIVNVTKFGFFVELSDLFIEGLVPIDSLEDDLYSFRELRGRSSASARARRTPSATASACWPTALTTCRGRSSSRWCRKNVSVRSPPSC